MNPIGPLLIVICLAPAVPAQLYSTPVYATSDSPIGLLVTDVNGDGHLDAVVSDAANDDVRILFGDGHGVLTAAATLFPGNSPIGIAAGDVNGDGITDIVASLWENNFLSVNLGLNHGGYAPPVKAAAPDGPRDVVLADLDGDGDLDALTANYQTTLASVLLNTGGTFTLAQGCTAAAVGGEDATANDIDLDGDLDAVISCQSMPKLIWFPNDGTGTLGAGVVLTVVHGSDTVAVADFDGNGWPDLAGSPEYAVPIFYGTGGGAFAALATVPLNGYGPAIDAGDANGDGHVDLVCGSAQGDGLVLLGDGAGGFSPTKVFHAGPSAATVRLADLDEDGNADAVTISNATGVGVRLGDGFGAFPEPRHVQLSGYEPMGLSAQDLDLDGLVDLASANQAWSNVSLVRNEGAGLFDEAAVLAASTSPSATACADLDGDGVPDVAASLYGSATLAVWRGTGSFALGAPSALVPLHSYPVGLAIADMGVGAAGPDIVLAEYTPDLIDVVAGDGAGGFLAPVSYVAGKLPNSPQLADIDGDGDRDIVYVQAGAANLAVLRNAGGSFGAPETWPIGGGVPTPLAVALGDLDEDGDLDAVTANNQAHTVSVFRAAGGGFGAAISHATIARYPNAVQLSDVDGDGHLDAVVTCSGDDIVSILPGNGAGALGAPQLFTGGREIDSGIVADFDADGRLDVAVGEFTETLAVLLTDSTSPWKNLAHGLHGTDGAPVLVPTGTLQAGEPVTLALSGALPGSTASLVLGLSALDLPFKGGTLVPAVDALIVGLPTGTGVLPLGGTMPAGLPAGVTLHAQYWVVDAGGPQGFAASNAVVGLTP